MATRKYLICLCMFMATIHAYRTTQSDEPLVTAGGTIDIVCKMDVPITRCGFTHPNGTKFLLTARPGASTCKLTINATTSEMGIWTCHFWKEAPEEEIKKIVDVRVVLKFAVNEENRVDNNDNSKYTDSSDVDSDIRENIADDEPIVISTTTYVCSTIAFLSIFVGLVYWRYRYYTVYYGKTWGDDDSIDSRVMKIKADPTAVIEAGDYLLITQSVLKT